MSKSDTSLLFSSVFEELEVISHLNIDSIASQIMSIGFECTHCGKCCRGSYGDNSVLLNSEDLCLLEKNSLRDEFVIPMADFSAESHDCQLVDENGSLHTFGWVLRRTPDLDCVFLGTDSRCRIYDYRPYLCRTYPFLLNEGNLEVCECEGLGKPISPEAAKELAIHIVHRKSVELNDTIKIYEKFLEAGFTLEEKDLSDVCEVSLVFVHDTNGLSEFETSRL